MRSVGKITVNSAFILGRNPKLKSPSGNKEAATDKVSVDK